MGSTNSGLNESGGGNGKGSSSGSDVAGTGSTFSIPMISPVTTGGSSVDGDARCEATATAQRWMMMAAANALTTGHFDGAR